MAPVAQDSVEFVELEVSHKIRNITLALYAADETTNELTVLNAIVSAFGASPIVSIPNIVGLEVVENSGRRLASESSCIQISYKIQSSTQLADVDSKEAESTLGETIEHSVHQGEFQQALRDYAVSFNTTSLAYAITTDDGFSVQWQSPGDDTDDAYLGYDQTTALVIFTLTVFVLITLLCLTYGRVLCCPKANGDEPMSLADQARQSVRTFEANREDLEMTWVQTDTGLVRATRRREDMVVTPMSTGRGGERYQGIGSSDSHGEVGSPRRDGRVPASPATDPFSNDQPIFDLLGDSPEGGIMSVSPSTGSMLPHNVGTGKKISVNIKGMRGTNDSMTMPSRQQDDAMDDFLAIAARNDHGSPGGGASDEVDEILF